MSQWLSDLVGFVPFALRAVARMLKLTEPKIVIRRPYNPASEPHLVWWHVEVKNLKREKEWVKTADANLCSVDLEFTPILGGAMVKARGVWSTSDGPKEKITLQAGDEPSHVPIALRSSENCLIYLPVQPGIVYITGVQYLTQRVGTEQLDLGDYEVRVIVRSGGKIWRVERFYLEIRGTGLSGFVLSEWPDNL